MAHKNFALLTLLGVWILALATTMEIDLPPLPAGARVVLGYCDRAAAGTRALRLLRSPSAATTHAPTCAQLSEPTFALADAAAAALPPIEVTLLAGGASPLALLNINAAVDDAFGAALACAVVDQLSTTSGAALTVLAALRLDGPGVRAARVGRDVPAADAGFPELAADTPVDDAFLSPLLRYAQLAGLPTTLLACAGPRFRRRDPKEDGTDAAICALGVAAVRAHPELEFVDAADAKAPTVPLFRVVNWPPTAEQQVRDALFLRSPVVLTDARAHPKTAR